MALSRSVKLILIAVIVVVVVGLALGLGLGLGLKSSGSGSRNNATGLVMVPTTTGAAFNCAARAAQCATLAQDPNKSTEVDACLAELLANKCQ